MKTKTIQKWVLIGALGGLYLTCVFAYYNFGIFGHPDNNAFSQLIYYFFCCFLLLSIYFLLKNNQSETAKIFVVVLVISILGSLFWHANSFGNNTNDPSQSVFVFSVVIGSLMGGFIPWLGIIPNALFFWGIISSLFVFYKQAKQEPLIISETTSNINSITKTN